MALWVDASRDSLASTRTTGSAGAGYKKLADGTMVAIGSRLVDIAGRSLAGELGSRGTLSYR